MSSAPAEGLREPPKNFLQSIRFLGPGLILSAAIVGSGELIATTALGAKAGFTLIWVIFFACLAKVAIQLEYGRHCIIHRKTTFYAWNESIGPRFFGMHWAVFFGFLYLIGTLIGLGGVIGGAAQVAWYAIPGLPINVWVVILVVVLFLLVFHGYYKPIELTATALNVLFVSAIIFSVFALQTTPYAYSAADIASGFSFQLPAEVIPYALTVFAITGLSPGEIFIYPSWCLEKGYGAYTGPRDESAEWVARAKGWMRVMTYDALLSMVIYLVSTIAFYILGAAILANQAELADGNELVAQLSSILTKVLGEGWMALFMLGAFAVLFSTAFANTAGFARMWADLCGVCKIIDQDHPLKRRRTIALFAFIVPAGWGLTYVLFQQPLMLIVFLGIVNVAFLLVVAFLALVYRYRETESRLKPSRFYDVALWVSIIAIMYIAGRSIYSDFIARFFG